MKSIDSENLISGNYYYIHSYDLENQKKFMGCFIRIYNYNYYSIAIFNNVQYLNSDNKSIITKAFIINDFYNYTHFFVPETEILLLKQIFRLKIGDDYFIKELL
jgi:hypothetical protein